MYALGLGVLFKSLDKPETLWHRRPVPKTRLRKKKPNKSFTQKDVSQLANSMVASLMGDEADGPAPFNTESKTPAAVALGRVGGKARASKLLAKKRADITKKAAATRWRKRK